MLSWTDSIFEHDLLHLVDCTARSDDVVVARLGQVEDGGAQPCLLAVTQLATVKHMMQTGVQTGELLHTQTGLGVADVGGGERKGTANMATHLSQEWIVRYPHPYQVGVWVEIIVELFRSREHKCDLKHPKYHDILL